MSPADLGQGQPGTSAVRHRADVSGGVVLNDTTPDDVAVVERRWSR